VPFRQHHRLSSGAALVQAAPLVHLPASFAVGRDYRLKAPGQRLSTIAAPLFLLPAASCFNFSAFTHSAWLIAGLFLLSSFTGTYRAPCLRRGGLRRVHNRKNRVSALLIFSYRLPASRAVSQRHSPKIFPLLIANWFLGSGSVRRFGLLPRTDLSYCLIAGLFLLSSFTGTYRAPRLRRGFAAPHTRAPPRGARPPPPLRGGGRRARRLAPRP
jgi:hypothetical protein